MSTPSLHHTSSTVILFFFITVIFFGPLSKCLHKPQQVQNATACIITWPPYLTRLHILSTRSCYSAQLSSIISVVFDLLQLYTVSRVLINTTHCTTCLAVRHGFQSIQPLSAMNIQATHSTVQTSVKSILSLCLRAWLDHFWCLRC